MSVYGSTVIMGETSVRPRLLSCYSKSQFSLSDPESNSRCSLDSTQRLGNNTTPFRNKSRIASICKGRRECSFGAQVSQIGGQYYVTCVQKYDDFGYRSGAYRAGLSFADRILSINQLVPDSISDVQSLLDNSEHLTIMFEQQPDLLHAWVPLKNGRLRGMTTTGQHVGKVNVGGVAHRLGVREGLAILAIDRQCILGMSDEVVNTMIWKRTGSLHKEVQLTLVEKAAHSALLDCLKMAVWAQQIPMNISDYVNHTLQLDRPLRRVDYPCRVEINDSFLFYWSYKIRLWRRLHQ
ncbi:hypothetical protein SARC_03685 [Sphaeroforma arctica JP610]|uniref:PDZ domain-containing protein n=1 Tax=Sphaeroforma arctica JP610 TaxID=667725 RepID=A0A0L0G4Y7_9EUKA|nr:hypothetical protein SARC_03685 [Sphaeroforma arctica JP610]KNC84092.1 hypothetical protein SARC_03685 [Sphaeroforma arctica JP610]|eukprot:XP_014157994.1 hypothetical protein SARC_03685 [Sphaeroforma arctica JP610]